MQQYEMIAFFYCVKLYEKYFLSVQIIVLFNLIQAFYSRDVSFGYLSFVMHCFLATPSSLCDSSDSGRALALQIFSTKTVYGWSH